MPYPVSFVGAGKETKNGDSQRVRATAPPGVLPNTVDLVSAGIGQEEGSGQNARATGGPGILPGASNEKKPVPSQQY